ncbi:DUF72 domain-containing protein [Pseudomonas solani]|uniref:DUF72 domain-containing protein n=1 Tax=Pseudomonas solani TaxID=2731552 RepID=UPI003C2E73A0
MAEIRIGISGWRYAPWRGDFYPKGLVQKKELRFASRAVNSIEINGSFYALQTPERYAGWAADTPEDFLFSVKAPRYITHVKRLRDVQQPVANFMASGLFHLGEKLGPLLWQFPPSFAFDPALFADFLALLPRDSDAARTLARHSDARLHQAGYLDIPKGRPLRHAVEIRNDSFRDEAFIALLRQHGVALVVADTAKKWPYAEDLTSDFVYMRLHGDKQLYASGYSPAALKAWKKRIEAWSQGSQPDDARLISAEPPAKRASRDVYCYFDNDIKVRAPYDARHLLETLKLATHLQTEPGQALEGADL